MTHPPTFSEAVERLKILSAKIIEMGITAEQAATACKSILANRLPECHTSNHRYRIIIK